MKLSKKLSALRKMERNFLILSIVILFISYVVALNYSFVSILFYMVLASVISQILVIYKIGF